MPIMIKMKGEHLNFLGINLGKRRAASKDFCQLMLSDLADLAFIQEPNIIKFRDFAGVVGISGNGLRIINNIHGDKTRAILVSSNRVNLVALPNQSDPDCAIATVNLNGTAITVASVYCDILREMNCDIRKFCKIMDLARKVSKGRFIIHTDSNARSPIWFDCIENSRRRELAEWLPTSGAVLLNTPGLPTFDRKMDIEVESESESERSWIDLTLADPKTAAMISDWLVSDEPSLSDHRFIRSLFL